MAFPIQPQKYSSCFIMGVTPLKSQLWHVPSSDPPPVAQAIAILMNIISLNDQLYNYYIRDIRLFVSHWEEAEQVMGVFRDTMFMDKVRSCNVRTGIPHFSVIAEVTFCTIYIPSKL